MTTGGALRRRVALTANEIATIARGAFIKVALGANVRFGPHRLAARSALVGRAGGRVVAYANLCQHNPVPLDLSLEPERTHEGAIRAPMAEDGAHLACHSHGAVYRPDDGECVVGPCYGQRLFAIDVEEDDGGIALVVDA